MTNRKDFEAFAATLQLDGQPYGLSLDRLVDDRRYASLQTEAAYQSWAHWQSLLPATIRASLPVDIYLPERVVDTLMQEVGLSTYHPDGDLNSILQRFAQAVKREVLARIPSTTNEIFHQQRHAPDAAA